MEKNIRRYADIGLNCIITELDIALANPSAADALDLQTKEYGAITRIFLRNDNCPSMLVWGISDNHSWRENQPLLFDTGLKAKPAYYSVHAQLRRAATAIDMGVESECPSTRPIQTTYIDMYGRVTTELQGIVVERCTYTDGRVVSTKKIRSAR